jgi:hypothetical protein
MNNRKRAHNRAQAFADDMIHFLKGKRGFEWKLGTAEGDTKECVDIIGWKNGNRRVLVEVELRRIAPLANVVKVWKQLTREKPHKKLVMFQAFSAFYPKNGTQRTNAEFVGEGDGKGAPAPCKVHPALYEV